MIIRAFLSIIIFLLLYSKASAESAITFELGDRLGDNLASYCHARWLSYKFDIPLRYTPFKNSDKLLLHNLHRRRDPQEKFNKVITYPAFGTGKKDIHSLGINKETNNLYVIPYFPETRVDAIKLDFFYFDIGWDDEQFLNQLRNEIRPIVPINFVDLPPGKISVAVHLRRGSGPDNNFDFYQKRFRSKSFIDKAYPLYQKRFRSSSCIDKAYPLRFPPDSFFIKQIKRISVMFYDKPLYIHFFTDDKDPVALMQYFKSAVNKPNIEYDCRRLQENPESIFSKIFLILPDSTALLDQNPTFPKLLPKYPMLES